MKYTVEVVIEKSREEVINKIGSIENLKHWQSGLVKAEPISGILGEEGSKMKLEYKIGKREMTLIETIIKKKLPTEFHATYDTKGVHNIQKNYFQESKPQQTRWISECEFQFSGFTMKIMGFLMPGAFKKQSLKYMNDFKAFVEEGISVSNQ
ncbi:MULTISPECIES: SRPBCC family protein [Mesonia]|uniref:Uncharacterized protein n=1 Tax=Mesonia oceanica TaxID=2687242 RepID=A0AC61Y9P0_9FLAO|nr:MULTISPECIES: SRPBCC family protein [Mesonia]MAN26101.1 hypothetical protein [Mesonia sp.]MAQ42234.1 hypothetical protein [Mesonia sp.]MBJ97898.1 hypothetical protein [Flavobacteriaceae bacterium]VVV00065.1 hypothetical protein FVB9532_01329 [Mesonia oceanica]|tara:strand:- start:53433 stop:53888 length:456 start_codon:yes stop_codon:yes gene_type:complete